MTNDKKEQENINPVLSFFLASGESFSFFSGKLVSSLSKSGLYAVCNVFSGFKFANKTCIGMSIFSSTVIGTGVKFVLDSIVKTPIAFAESYTAAALGISAFASSIIVSVYTVGLWPGLITIGTLTAIYASRPFDKNEFFDAKSKNIVKLEHDKNGVEFLINLSEGDFSERADVGVYLGLIKSFAEALSKKIFHPFLPAPLAGSIDSAIDVGIKKLLAPNVYKIFSDSAHPLNGIVKNAYVEIGAVLTSCIIDRKFSDSKTSERIGQIVEYQSNLSEELASLKFKNIEEKLSLIKFIGKYVSFRYLSTPKEALKDYAISLQYSCNMTDINKVYFNSSSQLFDVKNPLKALYLPNDYYSRMTVHDLGTFIRINNFKKFNTENLYHYLHSKNLLAQYNETIPYSNKSQLDLLQKDIVHFAEALPDNLKLRLLDFVEFMPIVSKEDILFLSYFHANMGQCSIDDTFYYKSDGQCFYPQGYYWGSNL